VLEYVEGATQSKAGVTSFAATVQTELATDIAPQFLIGLFTESPRDHGIPQSRTRIFFTGVNRMCMAHRAEQQLTPTGKALSPKKGFLRDLLLPNERPQADLSVRTGKQKSNIQRYRKMFDDANDDVDITDIAKCAMCDISRAPDKAFGSFFKLEESLILTTADSGKWVVGDMPGIVTGTGRFFTIEERALCQGMTPSSMQCLRNQTSAHMALGNTMAVDVIGAVIGCIMQPVCEWERRQMSPSPSVPRSGMDARRVWITRARALKRKPATAESPAQAETVHKAQNKKRIGFEAAGWIHQHHLCKS
jgi:hypothetical protein